jgi:hypothetical protein
MPSGSASWELLALRESTYISFSHCIEEGLLTNVHRPLALFNPAKSHPEVIIQAISARDRKKAEEYAKSHSIPEVKDTYQGN